MAAIWNSPSGLKEGTPPSPNQLTGKSMLESAVDNYQSLFAQLEEAINKLDSRLGVVSSEKPSKAVDACLTPKRVAVPIIEVIDKMADGITLMRNRIDSMIERLDI